MDRKQKIYWGRTGEEVIAEVKATMEFEGMPITKSEENLLRQVQMGEITTKQARQMVIKKFAKN